MNKTVTIQEAAKKLGCSDQTVRNYITSGRLSGKKVIGRWRVSLKSLTDLIDSFTID